MMEMREKINRGYISKLEEEVQKRDLEVNEEEL